MDTSYLWEIFVNLIENTIVAYLLFHRLTLRNSKHFIGTFISFVFFSSTLVSYCNLYQISNMTTHLAVFLFQMTFVSICFRNTMFEKTFTCCLPIFMSIFADQIPYTFVLINSADNLASLNFSGSNRIISTLSYLFVTFIFMIVFLNILSDTSSLPKNLNIFLVITTVVSLIVSTFFLDIIIEVDIESLPMKYRIQLNSISILILIIFLAMLFIIQIINKTYQENIKLAEQIHMYEKNKERNKTILQSTKSLQKWKHDYSNHLAVIHELIKAKSYHQLSQYVSQQRESLPQTFPIISTGHHIIDAILTDKYAIAQSEHISFTYSVVLPKHFPINDIEITGILGNLLDNSIEACIDIEREKDISPKINVFLKPQRSMYHIHIENSSSGNYLYKLNGQLDSTKTDQKNHGKGLTNVMEIAERYSGFCNITAEKDSFTADVYIPLLTER